MNEFIFLSHPIAADTPGYGGSRGFHKSCVKSISKGNSCNTSEWHLSSHIGTHMDSPYHFSESGKTVACFTANDFVFNNAVLIDYPAHPEEIITPGKWCDTIKHQCDILLIRTGFEQYRNEETYWKNNPGLSPELGNWLRTEQSNIKAIGVDFISISSFSNPEIGRQAHHAFLDDRPEGNPLIIIEDMLLSHVTDIPKRIILGPLRVINADGSPVTIIAEC